MVFFRGVAYTVLVLSLFSCGKNDSAEERIIQGTANIEAKQYDAAIIELKNAIRLDTQNGQARFLLGKLYLSLGNADSAAKELERALKLKYKIAETVPLLARAYMLIESDAEILTLEKHATDIAISERVVYLAYQTIAAIRSEKMDIAETAVQTTNSLDKENPYTLLANAYFEFASQNVDQANILVDKALALAPENADLVMLQGQLAVAEGNYQKAVESFKAYLVLQPESDRVQFLIADALIKTGQYDEAEKIADRIIGYIANQPFANYIKAMALFNKKDYEKTSEHAEIAINGGFNTLDLKLVAGASAFYNSNFETSHMHLSSVAKYLSPEHPAYRMLAVSQLRLGLIDEIGETLSQFKAETAEDSQFLSSLSFELVEVGAINEAKALVKNSQVEGTEDPAQQARDGVLKILMNDPTSGIEHLEKAMQLNPDSHETELVLGFAALQAGELDKAQEIAQKWLLNYPEKVEGYNLQASIYLKKEQLEKAQKMLEKGLVNVPDNIYALTELTAVNARQGNLEQAKTLSKTALSYHPDNLKVLNQYYVLNKESDGFSTLQAAFERHKDDINYGILVARALTEQKEYSQARDILNSFELDAKTPKQYWQLVLTVDANLKEKDALLKSLEKWRKTSPYHLEPVILLAKYWQAEDNTDRAMTVVKNAITQQGDNQTLSLLKMQLLLNSQRMNEAKSLYRKMDHSTIGKDVKTAIESRFDLFDKNYTDAIPKLRYLYGKLQSSSNVVYLAAALSGADKKPEAQTLLEEYIANNPKDDKVRNMLANLYLSNEESKAVKHYEELLQSRPNDVVTLNNLAWLYMDSGNIEQALKYSAKAEELAPEYANVVDTRGMVLLKAGENIKAWKTLLKAYKLSSGEDVSITLNYAQALIVNDQKQDALDVLKKAKSDDKEIIKRKEQLIELASN
ncbi:XrtA/PEP-CTERM system TPR-repeat protein PrsT [Thalassotalea sp. PLHSN55]|uniref:XrtA/PEP-CTERM system TPR-repeat protein PrsT n=1 Tax=Thalassotalea sp. PLHSN55 TaxID=3435888 RepID=UPI003F86394F